MQTETNLKPTKPIIHKVAILVGPFIGILGGFWLFLELINNFHPTWGQAIQNWYDGAGLWILLLISALVTVVAFLLSGETLWPAKLEAQPIAPEQARKNRRDMLDL